MTTSILLRGELAARAVLRRRLAVVLLTAIPIAFYFASTDSPGRAVRALAFGLSWALSTVAFFAAVSGRELEPRLVLAGWPGWRLVVGRLLGLGVLGAALVSVFALLVGFDQPSVDLPGVLLSFGVTAIVALALGSAIGTLTTKELEGTLLLFFAAGLQAVVNPFDAGSRLLPFWSSRELATVAVDGGDVASRTEGLLHAVGVIGLCAIVVMISVRRRAPQRSRG